jgi:hypothetical protein
MLLQRDLKLHCFYYVLKSSNIKKIYVKQKKKKKIISLEFLTFLCKYIFT